MNRLVYLVGPSVAFGTLILLEKVLTLKKVRDVLYSSAQPKHLFHRYTFAIDTSLYSNKTESTCIVISYLFAGFSVTGMWEMITEQNCVHVWRFRLFSSNFASVHWTFFRYKCVLSVVHHPITQTVVEQYCLHRFFVVLIIGRHKHELIFHAIAVLLFLRPYLTSSLSSPKILLSPAGS